METGDCMQQQHFCLRWNNYQSNMTSVFDQLRADETFVDVTLACEGKHLKAHKVVLSACSPYFKSVLLRNPCKHPIIILPRDVRYVDLCNVIEFVYRGEIDVAQEQLNNLLQTADQLQIKGLCEVGDVRTCPVVPLHRLPSPSVEPRRTSSTTATVCESSNRRKQYLSSIPPRKLSRCESPMDDESWSAVAADDDTDDDGSDCEPCCDYTAANTVDSCWPSGEAGQMNGSSDQQLRCGSPASRHSNSPPTPAADHQLRSSPADNTTVAPPVCTIQPIQLQDAPLDLASASCGSGPALLSLPRTLDVTPCSLQMFPSVSAAQQSSAAAAGATQQQAYQAAIAAITAANTSLYQLSQPQHTPVSMECDRKLWSEDSMEMALDSLRTQRMTLSKASVTYGIPSTTLWQRAHKIGIETPKKDGSNKNWTEEDLKLALNDLRNGKMSANKASKWYGIPNSTLYKIAKKEGIKLSAPFSNAQTSWKPADLERALLAIRGGMSVMKAGSEFGIPAGTLYGRCRRAGIELKPAGQPWNEHDMQHALQALQRGDMSINRAAQHFNLPYSSLYGRSKRHGLLPDTVPLSLLAPTDLQPTPPTTAATHTGTHTDG